ncbi:hypothetical protein TPA0908_48220 [Micromonospora sp. AKA38]|nr:hypothetical protein TPA0908_48220 [Micromonospora sp. AKA38]
MSASTGGVSVTDHPSPAAGSGAAVRRVEASVAPMAGSPDATRMASEAATDIRPWSAVEWVA